jgi:multiple sugar transport system ATP-binding protein
MVYVTHDQTEAMTLADKIVVLRDGRVEQVGSPMELYNNPVNQFVAGFLGSPAMNFLKKTAPDIPPVGVLGIRPEHLRIAANGRINGTVTHVERLGGDTNLLVSTVQGEPLTVRIFGQDDTQVGEKVALDFDDTASFLFDDNGSRVAEGIVRGN